MVHLELGVCYVVSQKPDITSLQNLNVVLCLPKSAFFSNETFKPN